MNCEEPDTPKAKNVAAPPPEDILVSPMKKNEKELACERLGLTFYSHPAPIYSPYFMDPFALEYPQELKDCGGDGDCFFKYKTNELLFIPILYFCFQMFPTEILCVSQVHFSRA